MIARKPSPMSPTERATIDQALRELSLNGRRDALARIISRWCIVGAAVLVVLSIPIFGYANLLHGVAGTIMDQQYATQQRARDLSFASLLCDELTYEDGWADTLAASERHFFPAPRGSMTALSSADAWHVARLSAYAARQKHAQARQRACAAYIASLQSTAP